MTTTWTLNPSSPNPIPVRSGSSLELRYFDEGTVGLSTAQLVTTVDCTSEADTVSIVLTKAGSNCLEASKTSVTLTPANAPNATWSYNSTGTTVTLSFPVPPTNEETTWVYDMIPTAPITVMVPVALMVKVVVKRPPEDPRP